MACLPSPDLFNLTSFQLLLQASSHSGSADMIYTTCQVHEDISEQGCDLCLCFTDRMTVRFL